MSTEIRVAASARRLERARRSYRRTVALTLGGLVAASAVLGTVGAFRGPGLASWSVSAASAVERPGQRLILSADQGLAPVGVDDVEIEPAAPFDVESTGSAVTVRFTGTLDAATTYRVAVAARSSATGIAERLAVEFQTPDLELTVLARDPAGPDEVRRRTLGAAAPEVLYSADRIQEFALTARGVAAIVLDDSEPSGRLVVREEGRDLDREVVAPLPGRLGGLGASPTGDLVGFVVTPEPSDDPEASEPRLAILDLADPSGVPTVVTGLDGDPVAVLDWVFVPGTTALVVQAFDESLLLVDPVAGTPPTPLGQHAELRGFLPGTLRLVVADPAAGSTIDLRSGETVTLDLPADGLGDDVYPGDLVALDEESYVEDVSRVAPGDGFRLDPVVLAVSRTGAELLLDPEPGIVVSRLCPSPNGQYVAIELLDPAGDPDGYPFLPGRSGTTTVVVDVASGATAASVVGAQASWCG